MDGGTLVVVEGPRFSTRAESRWHAAMGWSVVGMTGHPEAVLARELELCYTTMTLVTDLDAGAEAGEGVSHGDVLKVFAANVDRLRAVLFDAVTALPAEGAQLFLRACAGRDRDGDRIAVRGATAAWSWLGPGPGSSLVLARVWSWFRPGPDSGRGSARRVGRGWVTDLSTACALSTGLGGNGADRGS